jgi:hypothetical protein
MTSKRKRKRDDSQEVIARTVHELSCWLAGVPNGSRAPTDGQMRTTILDLAARKSGMSRDPWSTATPKSC